MENQDPKNLKQDETTAQGAAGSSETSKTEGADVEKSTDIQSEILTAESPEWVSNLIESNKATQESNEKLTGSIESLVDVLTSMANSGAKGAKSGPMKDSSSQKEVVKPEFNPKAKYVVAKGRKFQDQQDFKTTYREGANVDHLGPDRLKTLLSLGLVKED